MGVEYSFGVERARRIDRWIAIAIVVEWVVETLAFVYKLAVDSAFREKLLAVPLWSVFALVFSTIPLLGAYLISRQRKPGFWLLGVLYGLTGCGSISLWLGHTAVTVWSVTNSALTYGFLLWLAIRPFVRRR